MPETKQLMYRQLPGEQIRKVQEDSRKVEISFSSETPYARWWGNEILDHSDGCCDLQRLNSIGVVLYNHNTDDVIGKIIEAKIEDGRGIATIEFDEDEDSDKIFKKVKSGTLKGVSVGYIVDDWEIVEEGKQSQDGRFTGPVDIAKRWTPLELSIVSVPADATVGVERSAEFVPAQVRQAEKKKGPSDLAIWQVRQNINRLTD